MTTYILEMICIIIIIMCLFEILISGIIYLYNKKHPQVLERKKPKRFYGDTEIKKERHSGIKVNIIYDSTADNSIEHSNT